MQRVLPQPTLHTPHTCGRQPKVIFDMRGNRVFCECAPCRFSTARFATEGEAVREWDVVMGILMEVAA
jgi:hypothetical protein